MKIHELKIKPEHFADIILNHKMAEFRLNDRDYQVGDHLILKEWNGDKFTGDSIKVRVSHITDLSDFLPEGYNYVMLSFDGWSMNDLINAT